MLNTGNTNPIEYVYAAGNTTQPIETFIAENGKDKLAIARADLMYIECADNYSTFVYYTGGIKKKHILRGSLKFFMQQVKNNSIVRCHRTFIVNLQVVKQLTGNSQGYNLVMENTGEKIPVSRKHANDVISKYRTFKKGVLAKVN